MFISTQNEQISLASVSVKESLKPSPMETNPDSPDGFPLASDSTESPPLSTIYTDVNVVPEHEQSELIQSISNLEGEIAQLRLKHKLWNEKRRESLNKILDIKGTIRVFCRVRPFLAVDRRKIHEPIAIGSEKIVVKSAGTRKEFEFDKVFPQEISQGEVFVEVEPILRSALDGHNVSVLAYGQTGTGKTFTMDGTNEQPGIIPRALKELFRQASSEGETLTFSMSMLEVYMGSLRDLLAPKPTSRAYEPVTRCNLNIQTDQKGSVEIEGITEVQILDYAKAKWWYSRGRRARSTSWTNVNETSSRSHCLTRISIFRHGNGSGAKTELSKLWMVDLGGSERLLKTGAIGLTLDEGRAINLSLSALGDVIAALRRKRGHVPYRNSKLTQILKDSLGDGSKVLMLIHVSPWEEDVGETICSLCFAKRARAVESNREQLEDLKKQKEKRIHELEGCMREAKEECQKVQNQIQKFEFILSENKKLFSNIDHQPLLEREENVTLSPKHDLKQVKESNKQSEKETTRIISSSLPRFMTSTVASRERQSAAERDLVGRARVLRAGTRSSIHFAASQSQSISFSDRHFKATLQNSNRKKHVETDNVNVESPKFNGSASDSKSASLPKSRMVTSSDPNIRATLGRHRRRMSDLI
ncbi:Kinesin-like protein [Parasponia andersonii]|uniref:Kinesin-like protein n=1 Tax=Parasponia andersonii TaxID=3476 RepID=A0A2P5DL05_PARAD|nr:Kinesin-like protein [Parasponia andersonii]